MKVIRISMLLAGLVIAAASFYPVAASAHKKPDHGRRASRVCHPRRNSLTEGAHTFTHDGQERSYLLSLPKQYKGRVTRPLVFNFHGGGGTKESTEAYTKMGEKGARRGYIVVTPQALGSPAGWNLFGDPNRVDDYGFIDALAEDLSQRLCIDEDRIYAAGHSNGSAFAGLLVCKEPYRFSAAAMVAAFVPPNYAGCPEDVTPSVVAFHGTEDPGIPYEGGFVEGITLEGEFYVPGVRDTLDAYGSAYDCKSKLKERRVAQNVIKHSYKHCDNRSKAALYSIIGGGHEWPGGSTGTEHTKRQFSATDSILRFFKKH